MIDPVTSQAVLQGLRRAQPGTDGLPVAPLPPGLQTGGAEAGAAQGTSFSDLIGGLVESVDARGKAAESEVRRLMLGETDNIHQSMIAMQEAGVAFTLLVEVRNKLVESYQELMRMPV